MPQPPVILFGHFYRLILGVIPNKKNGLYFPNFMYFITNFPNFYYIFPNVKEKVASQNPK